MQQACALLQGDYTVIQQACPLLQGDYTVIQQACPIVQRECTCTQYPPGLRLCARHWLEWNVSASRYFAMFFLSEKMAESINEVPGLTSNRLKDYKQPAKEPEEDKSTRKLLEGINLRRNQREKKV